MHENPHASLHAFQTDQAFGALASRMEARGLIERVPGPGRAFRQETLARLLRRPSGVSIAAFAVGGKYPPLMADVKSLCP